jgi:hypothetical protein
MLDRDEDSTIANLKDDWQPPSSALPEIHQYRKQLVQHIAALPFGAGTSSYTERALEPESVGTQKKKQNWCRYTEKKTELVWYNVFWFVFVLPYLAPHLHPGRDRR